ncbi:MAG TPA: tetratricopeptide repeat protein [Longimicrobiaceae bacterium]|nr:tetratricopeptide repeat protein [Longimicrobiaceae bacterium]
MTTELVELEALRSRRGELAEALRRSAEGGTDEVRTSLRDGILALFRDTERLLEEVAELKESIRPLVEEYRRQQPAGKPSAPRVDHLGSSTFVARAWNAIAGCQYDTAAREAARALDLAPGDAQAATLLAWARMRLGRLDEARALLEPIVERDPAQALARVCLGYVALMQERFAEAIEHLSRVVREGSDRKAVLYANLYLGRVYAEREMYRDAKTFFAAALELGPNLIEAYWEMGRAHARAGEMERAVEAWRRGAETNRFNAWGERCERAAERAAAGEPVELD